MRYDLFHPRFLDWQGSETLTPYSKWPTHQGKHIFEVCLAIGIVVGDFRHKREFWTVPSVTVNVAFGQRTLKASKML